MKIKKDYFYSGILIMMVLAAAFFYFRPHFTQQKSQENPQASNANTWAVDGNGYLAYPLNRGIVNFSRTNYTNDTNQPDEKVFVSKIVYQSGNRYIYGLLVLPKSVNGQMPGIVLLPGAGVSKESELGLAKKISELGTAVLVIDQRGVGETDGYFPNLDEDYSNFLKAKEPMQHLMVYDALRAYDLLYSAPFIDTSRIILAGESLGGRVAVIAAAIDKNINGALVISSAGFGFRGGNDTNKNAFVKSIDSDHYIAQIAPRKIAMMHNLNDNIIPLSSAAKSFSIAQEPKRFILINDTNCNHGYCDSMHEGLVAGLDYLIGVKLNN